MAVDGFLVTCSFGIGNCINKTPMLLALRRLFPTSPITVWCCHTVGYEVLKGLREHWNQPEPLFNILKRSDSPGGHTTAIISVPSDETFRRSAVAQRYIEYNTEKAELFGDRHEVEVNMDLVRQLGYKGLTPVTRIYVSKEDQQEIDEKLCSHKFSKYKAVIAIHNGSLNTDLWKLKRWDESKIVELINAFKKRNILPVLIGTKDDTTVEVSGILNLVGELSIKHTAAVLARCSLLVSTDSGPAHLADAMGTPTIVLFGATHISKNKPFNYGEAITAGLECSPCYWTDRMKKCEKNTCLGRITVKMITDRIDKKLGV